MKNVNICMEAEKFILLLHALLIQFGVKQTDFISSLTHAEHFQVVFFLKFIEKPVIGSQSWQDRNVGVLMS